MRQAQALSSYVVTCICGGQVFVGGAFGWLLYSIGHLLALSEQLQVPAEDDH